MDIDSIDEVEIYRNNTQNEFMRETNMKVLSRHELQIQHLSVRGQR